MGAHRTCLWRCSKVTLLAGVLALVGIAVLGCAETDRGQPSDTRPRGVASAAPSRQKSTKSDITTSKSASAKTGSIKTGSTKTARPAIAENGQQLYARHCAACHGEKGDGRGLAARFLFPKPRDFRAGQFRLVSTVNGRPTKADIEGVLTRGMPGSAMIPWAHLSETDRKLLADQVLEFRKQGARDIELAMAAEADDELTEEDLDAAVKAVTTPSEVLAVPRATAHGTATIARGKELYRAKACASCHGETGKGDGQQQMVDSERLPTRPRDLTLGIFKGASDFASVYRRLALGMPGSPMPSSQNLTSEEIADLVHFVLSLSDETTRTATVLARHRLTARFVKQVPISPDAKAWRAAAPVRLAMTPLWWRDEPDPGLQVQALHDGKSLCLRLAWSDKQPDMHAARSEAFEDAVAVELYRGDSEPFVGMGGPGSPVDVWMWDADRQGRPTEVEDANPRLAVDIYPFSEQLAETAEYGRAGTKAAAQPKHSLPALAAGNQIVPVRGKAAGTALEAGGPGSVTFLLPTNQRMTAQGKWTEGRWAVVMAAPLKSLTSPVSLKPGQRVSVAFAIWNGSRRDRDGQKWITIWQDLVLERSGLKRQPRPSRRQP